MEYPREMELKKEASMKKGNVVDIKAYLSEKDADKKDEATETENIIMSQELENAIELLIKRLRELGPIQKTH